MQIISPQQIPGLLQNDFVYTLYAYPPNTREWFAVQKDSQTETRQRFSFYHNC